ncbi:hypothetical protein BH10CYA1_BH10CYA1_55690 [soil metagenome]
MLEISQSFVNRFSAKYKLLDQTEKSNHLPDGTIVSMDPTGRVTQVQYASGTAIGRHEDFVIVKSGDSSYWFGSENRWSRID